MIIASHKLINIVINLRALKKENSTHPAVILTNSISMWPHVYYENLSLSLSLSLSSLFFLILIFFCSNGRHWLMRSVNSSILFVIYLSVYRQTISLFLNSLLLLLLLPASRDICIIHNYFRRQTQIQIQKYKRYNDGTQTRCVRQHTWSNGQRKEKKKQQSVAKCCTALT